MAMQACEDGGGALGMLTEKVEKVEKEKGGADEEGGKLGFGGAPWQLKLERGKHRSRSIQNSRTWHPWRSFLPDMCGFVDV
jgi:hypothetical protein